METGLRTCALCQGVVGSNPASPTETAGQRAYWCSASLSFGRALWTSVRELGWSTTLGHLDPDEASVKWWDTPASRHG